MSDHRADPEGDPLLAALAALPAPPLDPAAEARVLVAARRALADEPAGLLATIAALWSRALLPAAMTLAACAQLGWALHVAAALHR